MYGTLGHASIHRDRLKQNRIYSDEDDPLAEET